MKITKKAFNYGDADMIMQAEAGDFLPNTITIHHNDREIVYRYEDRKN